MISYHEAIFMIDQVAAQYDLGTSIVGIEEALGRVTAEDIVVPEDVPSFHSSAMDGFVIDYRDTLQATVNRPALFNVVGTISAGDLQAIEQFSKLEGGQTIEVMTGAPIPAGVANAVVKIEDVEIIKDQNNKLVSIQIKSPVKLGENVRLSGSDYQSGELLIKKNSVITPEVLMAMANVGVSSVRVKNKLKLGLIATGKEVADYRENNLQPGMIRNSTSIYIKAVAEKLGAEFCFYGLVPDDSEKFKETYLKAVEDKVDILLSTGAVSMGKFDFIKNALIELGARILFHKVAIRPGKPILFAEITKNGHHCVYFGLPGNQISTGVGMRFFVQPFVSKVLGLSTKPITAKLIDDVKKPADLRCFFKGLYHIENGLVMVQVLNKQNSYIVSSMVESNCWVELSELNTVVMKSECVSIYPIMTKERIEV